jgi:hypothetical protein
LDSQLSELIAHPKVGNANEDQRYVVPTDAIDIPKSKPARVRTTVYNLTLFHELLDGRRANGTEMSESETIYCNRSTSDKLAIACAFVRLFSN